jgi:hypothetical protein
MKRAGVEQHIIDATQRLDSRFEENMQALRDSKIPYCIIWSSNRVPDFTNDPAKILEEKAAMERVVRGMLLHYKK